MFGITLLFLAFGVPVAVLFSLWAGVVIFRYNKVLAASILIGAVASGLSFLWEMRYDIDLFRIVLGTRELLALDRYDPSDYFAALYAAVFVGVLFARFRWKPEFGSPLALNLALIFWPLAGMPYLLLTPGMFAN